MLRLISRIALAAVRRVASENRSPRACPSMTAWHSSITMETFFEKFLRFSLKRLTSFCSLFDRGYNSFNFIELCSDFVSGLLFALRLISGYCLPPKLPARPRYLCRRRALARA